MLTSVAVSIEDPAPGTILTGRPLPRFQAGGSHAAPPAAEALGLSGLLD